MSHNTNARQHEQWAIWQGGSGGYSLLKRPAPKKSSLKVSQSVLVLASALMAPHQLPVTVGRHDVILIRHDLHQVQCSSRAPRPVRHHPAGIAVTNITMNVTTGEVLQPHTCPVPLWRRPARHERPFHTAVQEYEVLVPPANAKASVEDKQTPATSASKQEAALHQLKPCQHKHIRSC